MKSSNPKPRCNISANPFYSQGSEKKEPSVLKAEYTINGFLTSIWFLIETTFFPEPNINLGFTPEMRIMV
jgi:hypothetical protein